MYDFYDAARHHHRSQCKHWTAFKRQAPSLAWGLLDTFLAQLLLGTFGYFWKPLLLEIGKLCSFGLLAKFTKARNNKLVTYLI